MQGVIQVLPLMLMFVGFACSSNTSDPSSSEIVGTYMGRYGGGVETFELNPDGSFTQTFQIRSKTIYNASGKWKVTGRVIRFAPFMSPDGLWSGKFDGNPDLTQGAPGSWERNPIRIEFTEWPYHAAKVRGHGASIEPYEQK